VAIATNIGRRAERLSRRGRRLWDALAALGVERLEVGLELPAGSDHDACRLPWAALRALDSAPPDRLLWLPNLDCVWIDPVRALGATPAAGRFGCLLIGYPPDWRVGGAAAIGNSRDALGATAAELAGRPGAGGAESGASVPAWVGADVLAGDARTLRALMGTCEQLEAQLRPRALASNEQLLTLSCALDRARAEDLSPLARRIQTGPRHGAAVADDAAALALWHLPAEKGLSLRRTASELLRGREHGVLADLREPRRAMRRFNVTTPGVQRRLRDGAWLLASPLRR
jgi:hypothetical protein